MTAREILVVHLTEAGAIPCFIQADLVSLQALVGGYVQFVPVLGDLQLVVNEEGALARPKVLPVWWVINGERIHGPSFLTRMGDVDGELDVVGLKPSEALQLALLLNRMAIEATSVPWVVEFARFSSGFVDSRAN